MTRSEPDFAVKLAETPQELRAAQRLRYQVFIEELGGQGALVDHDNCLEMDRFDPFCDHLILMDRSRSETTSQQVIGVYRLLRRSQALAAGQFYSESEYDLSVLKNSDRRLLELGRSCLHPDYRGGAAMFHLWNGLADYVQDHDIELLFGVASFHGTDVLALKQPLSFLHHRHLAPDDIRTKARPDHFQPMNLIPEDQIDRRDAMVNTPALIKAYLRLGGFVGEGAYIDHAFNTTDICLVMDTARMNTKKKKIYTRGRDI